MASNKKYLRTIVVLTTLGGIFLAIYTLFTFREAKIIIEWETASEVNTVGFNILRSKTPDGDFEKINDELIPASDDPLTNNAYAYKDTNVQAKNTYYYLLLDIAADGTTTTHGPLEITATNQKWLELSLTGILFITAFLVRRQIKNQVEAKENDQR